MQFLAGLWVVWLVLSFTANEGKVFADVAFKPQPKVSYGKEIRFAFVSVFN